MGAEEREEWLAHFALICPDCGNLRSECSDPSIEWHPRVGRCNATGTTQWANRKLAEKYKDAKHDDATLSPLDGAGVWVSTVPPAEGEDEFA